MKECCEKWKDNIRWIIGEEGDLWDLGMAGSSIFLDLKDIKHCPECGSPLTQPKPELPERLEWSNEDIHPTYRVLATAINQLIKYLKLRGI